MSTDRLIFHAPDGAQIALPWAGDWPPPERLYMVHEHRGSAFTEETTTVVVDPETQSDDTLATLVLDHGAVLFVRTRASEIPTPAADDESWFRGALYEPWTEPSHA